MTRTTSTTCAIWLLWLVLLRATGPALAQSTSPFEVVVLPNSNSPISLPAAGLPLVATATYSAFSLGGSVAATSIINAMLLLPDGKVLIGGSLPNNKYLARLNADGSPDPTFNPTAVNDIVFALALQSDGKVLVGGFLTNDIVRLDSVGALDPRFTTVAPPNGLSTVTALAVLPNGQVLVGGDFPDNLVRLNATGTYDPSFTAPAAINNFVNVLLVQPDSKVLVGGNFGGALLRLNSDGTADQSFQAGSRFTGPSNPRVNDLVLQPDGKIVAGGYFNAYGTTFRGSIARLNSNGSLDLSFAPTSSGTPLGFDGTVYALALQADGQVLVGGDFGLYYGQTAAHIARLDQNGVLDQAFLASNTRLNGNVGNLAVQPDGRVLAAGGFTSYTSPATPPVVVPTPHLTRLTPTGSLNTTATAVPNATYTWSNGSTGATLIVAAPGSYTVTATAGGLHATSSPVVVGSTAPAFSVRVTPAGPFRLCAGGTQLLTAQVVGGPATPQPTYTWKQVQGNALVPVGTPGNTYQVSSPATPQQYVVTATIGSVTSASATITVSTMPTPVISNVSPGSGSPGTSIVVSGTHLDAISSLSIGGQGATFVVNSPSQLTAIVPVAATSGPVAGATPCGPATSSVGFVVPPPTITSLVPAAGQVGTSVLLVGTGFVAGATTVTFPNGVLVSAANVTVLSGTQLSVVVPAGAITGALLATTSQGPSSSSPLFTVLSGSAVVFTTTANLPLPAYTNLTIAAPGNVTLTQDLTISGRLDVQAGATLHTAGFRVLSTGTASLFTLAAGGTLTTGHPQGISTTGATGAIQLATRYFSPDASYGYVGGRQTTGPGLPGQVRNLSSTNTDSLKLTQPVRIAQVLTMAGAGNFYLNNQALTLLSGPAGTALVHNQGTGVVVGTATAQRYIDPTVNPTAGFRYYGAPVRGTRAAVFPTPVFAYDQTRNIGGGRRDTMAIINYGFAPAPLAGSDFLAAGRGYRSAVPAATTVGFVGTLTTDTLSLRLVRSLPASYSGWNLVSNPYPSPLDWSLVLPADRPGLDAAIYVYESTGPGTGYFRSYVNGAGTGSPLIAAGQAFFVRVSGTTPGGIGRLRFRNSQRVTVFDNATQPVFNRTALTGTIPELLLELARNGGGCKPCGRTNATHTPVPAQLNSVTIYTEPTATAGFDRLLDADAGNLFCPAQQTLGMRSSGSDTLAVQALPTFSATSTRRVPLTLTATAPGDYAFSTTAVALPTLLNGASGYLRDSSATTNRWLPLPLATPYTFTLSAAELLARVRPVRFYLYFGPVVALAATSSTALQSATVYPNPTHGQVGVQVPGVPGATQVQATLLTTLGQVVLRQEAALPATGATLSLRVPGLSSGVYILRLRAGDTTTTRRVVLE